MYLCRLVLLFLLICFHFEVFSAVRFSPKESIELNLSCNEDAASLLSAELHVVSNYWLKELNQTSLWAMKRHKLHQWACAFKFMGTPYISFYEGGLSYQLRLSPKFQLGLWGTIELQHSIWDKGIWNSLLGLQSSYLINRNNQWSVFLGLPVPHSKVWFGKTSFSHSVSSDLTLVLSASYFGRRALFKGQLFYQVNPKLRLDIFLSTQSSPCGFGFSTKWKGFNFSFSTSYHFDLGFSTETAIWGERSL